MPTKSGNHMIDLLFTLALFCVFAASALLVVLIGAGVYKNAVAQMDENFSCRTSITYVSNKIRQNDVAGGIYLASLKGQNALVLEQTLEGEIYKTWIYHHDGALRELFVSADTDLHPDDGQAIIQVQDFRFEQEGPSLILSSVGSEGVVTQQRITPRCP